MAEKLQQRRFEEEAISPFNAPIPGESLTASPDNAKSWERPPEFTDEEQATSILRGTIVRVTDAPYTFTKEEAVTEYRFTVHMKVEWFDVRDDKVLIEKEFSGWGAYGLSGDISSDAIDNDGDGLIDSEDDNEFGDPREFATTVAVTKIAEDVLNEIMTSW